MPSRSFPFCIFFSFIFLNFSISQPLDKEAYILKVNKDFDKTIFQAKGGEVRSEIADIITIWLEKGQIDTIKKMKGVEYVSLPRKIQPLLNKAVKNTNVNKVWEGLNMPQGFSGKDVIIGVTDWGFDYTHPSFYDTNLLDYRILRAWDQFREGGPAPDGFDYGTELIGKERLIEAQCDTSNVYGHHYHGTHVASIAGGSGSHTLYRGVAYDANFLLATFLVDEAAVIDAFNWMHRCAYEEGKRLVVNMSWGLYYMDNPDGKGPLNDVMQYFSNNGVVFVSSAGNNGDVFFHINYDFHSPTDTLKTIIGFDDYGQDNVWGQCVSMINTPHQNFDFHFSVLTNSYQKLQDSPIFSTTNGDIEIDTFFLVGADTIYYRVLIEKTNPYNERPKANLHVKNPSTGNYKFALIATADSGDFHAWNVVELTSRVGNWGSDFLSPMSGWKAGDNKCGVSTPGTQDCAITVAAHSSGIYNSDNDWSGSNIAYFSSSGPTIDNRIKPEISAPGSNVISAISSFTDHDVGSAWTTVTFEGREYEYIPLSGTSMSSPMVAGIIALVLQANPWLSPVQVKQILTETAYQDQYTIQHGVNRFGYGKVDAYAAVQKALQVAGILNQKVSKTTCSLFPNPATNNLFLTIQSSQNIIELEIYDYAGKLIEKRSVPTGISQLDITKYASGYYFLKLNNRDEVVTKKFIKL